MSFVTSTPPPRTYPTSTTVNWSVSNDVLSLTNVLNGIPPAISTYIAYDNLNPPNPFIATTQDGNGNVVYDGGFPKFYNSRLANNTGSDFNGLFPSLKFMYNTFNFIHNPSKSKRLLVLNDRHAGQTYAAKGTNANGFRTTTEYVANLAGFTITFIDVDDFANGVLDVRLAELNQYSCILVYGTGEGEITQASINDIVTFRNQGGGLFLVTDHGPDITSIETAVEESGGFFTLVNKIAINFGAYFTGDFNRQPVNVGFLRSTYGDHPLYNNLSNSEDILAGGSESKVVVTEVETYDPSNQPSTVITDSGVNIVSFLAIMNDGSVRTEQYCFNIGNEFLGVRTPLSNSDVNSVFTTYIPKYLNLSTFNRSADLGTLSGNVIRGGVSVGTFTVASDTVIDWSESEKTRGFINGDTYIFRVTSPFTYEFSVDIDVRNIPSNTLNAAHVYHQLKDIDFKHKTLPEIATLYRQYFALEGRLTSLPDLTKSILSTP